MVRSSLSIPALAAAFLNTLSVGVQAKEKPNGNPKELGRVVIVPFLDQAGEKRESKDEYRDTALEEVETRFKKYEIDYVPQDEVKHAMGDLHMVATDEEDRTKAKFKSLADTLKARYVVTGIIFDTNSDFRRKGSLGSERKTGEAKVQFRVFDAKEGRYAEELELTATSAARARAFESPLFRRAGKLRVKAVRDATMNAMAAFLKPYPKVHDEVPDDK